MLAHLVVWYLVFLFSITFHEYAHALVARLGGDNTAYQGGHLTLDPTPHVRRSPFGLLLVPIISYLRWNWMVGWASVPFDPTWGKQHPRAQALMSMAGPFANFLLAAIAFWVLRLMLDAGVVVPSGQLQYGEVVKLASAASERSPSGALVLALDVLLDLNVLLGLFNLLPVPPLDGAGILEGFLPRYLGPIYAHLRGNLMLELAGLLVCWQLFEYVSTPARIFVLTRLFG